MSERKKIQMLNLLDQFKEIEDEVLLEIKSVIESSAFINGPAVKEFSASLESFLEIEKVIPCGNGTDALQIALMALGLQPGDKVAVPAFTYVATVEVIALLKLAPVFIDVDYDTFNIDTNKFEEAARNHEIKAVIPVHLYGQSANMDQIMSISRKHGISVVEDNAQALGAFYKTESGKSHRTGTMGIIGTTSFFPTKNLGAFGDGGALMTNDSELGERIRMISSHGQPKKYYHDIIGVNSRLDTLQAAILNVKIKHLDEYASRRNKVADVYDKKLSGIDQLVLPKRNPSSTHVFHQYTLKVPNGKRDELQAFLMQEGIPSVVYYPLPQHLQKAYLSYGGKQGDYPVSELLCKEVLSLPIHTQMKDSDQQYICETIQNYFHG